MRVSLVVAALLAGSAPLASAQLVGGAVQGVTGATAGAMGALHPDGSAAVDPRPGSSDPAPSIVGGQTPAPKSIHVSAGARVRVARETRCYDGANSWDPSYESDGQYYCETRGPGAAADVSAGH